MRKVRFWLFAISYGLSAAAGSFAPAAADSLAPRSERAPQDEITYFLLPDRFENGDVANDRGGASGDRLATGFDLASKAFYNGGDLKGLTSRLDYIQGLGATAVWLAPIFKNKPVQGPKGGESAGYHGYWVTDFTQVDPHFGTNEELRAFVTAAHARGLKVYLDIIANHTADVIRYRECPTDACAYRSRADYPYSRRGGPQGQPINAGFDGTDFSKLTRADYAYTPFVPRTEEQAKVPAWLNDPIWYHNRGNTTFEGESATMGDFVGLDDLMTENPRVVQGFIDVFGRWIDDFRIDGYRIDTARHVNPEFWRAFVPAMQARARANGIPNFYIFGEVFTPKVDVALLARHTREAGLPAVLDFAFASAVRETLAGDAGTDVLARLFADDVLYEGGAAAALALPTFISNHDMGRFAWFVRSALPRADDAEVLKRVVLAHAMLYTLRGAPVVYYGDEQGFAGLGNDQDARQSLFASQVPRYNETPLVGTTSTTAVSNFNPAHPLYQALAELARLRAATTALRRGEQVVRNYSDAPGLFAVSRLDPATGREVVVAFNTASVPFKGYVEVNAASAGFAALRGECAPTAAAPGSYAVSIPPLDFVVCAAEGSP